MKKNGFTLIELLAVILILGIIALIAVPTVNAVVEQSRKESFSVGVSNLVEAMEKKCVSELLEGSEITSSYNFSDDDATSTLDIKGDVPTNGTAKVSDECKVEINASKNKYIAIKTFDEDSPKVYSNSELGLTYVAGTFEDTFIGILYMDPTNIENKCNSENSISTTGTKTGCMKWYIYDKNEDGTYDAILDHNSTSNVAWSKDMQITKDDATGNYYFVSGPTSIVEQLKEDTSNWNAVPYLNETYEINHNYSKYKIDYTNSRAKILTYAEVRKIVGKSEDDNQNDSFNFITLDSTYIDALYINAGKSNYYWLFDYLFSATCNGGRIDDDEPKDDNYSIYTTGYWLATTVYNSTSSVWIIDGKVEFNSQPNISKYYGLRPVITIPSYYID